MHDCRDLLKNSTIWLSGADRIGFLRNATRSRQTEKTHLANVLNFMLASLQHLGASERRVLPVQRSDFAEKLCFLALWWFRSVPESLRVGITRIVFANSPFVAQACSGAIKLAADASIHLLGAIFSVWLDRVASLRNSIKTIDFS